MHAGIAVDHAEESHTSLIRMYPQRGRAHNHDINSWNGFTYIRVFNLMILLLH